MKTELELKNLHVSVQGKEIVKGVSLKVTEGEIHAVMGPNGSGKSTLSYAVMGHPKYEITKGDVLVNGESILPLTPDQRAKKGLFLGFQYPYEVQGVGTANFIRNAANSQLAARGEKNIPVMEFQKQLEEKTKLLKMDQSFTTRSLNEGFSGGEKKRAEVLQMSLLKPKIAILDEPDSGLDIDALKIVANAVKEANKEGTGLLVITHYERILTYLQPDYVHVMNDGKIIKSGGKELAKQLEKEGYEGLVKKVELNASA